jgi:hypothetical protein
MAGHSSNSAGDHGRPRIIVRWVVFVVVIVVMLLALTPVADAAGCTGEVCRVWMP